MARFAGMLLAVGVPRVFAMIRVVPVSSMRFVEDLGIFPFVTFARDGGNSCGGGKQAEKFHGRFM